MADSDEQEQDDLDAIYAQQENEERAQWEARIKERGRRIAKEFDAEWREWLKEHA